MRALLLAYLLVMSLYPSTGLADRFVEGVLGLSMTDMVATAEVSGTCSASGIVQPDARDVRFAVVPIHARDPAGVILDAEVTAQGTSIIDTLMALYCFYDPSFPFEGLVAFDDDGGDGLFSRLSPSRNIVLAPDVTYYLVLSPFDAASTGMGQFRLRLGEGIFPGVSPTEGALLPSADFSLVRSIIHDPLLQASVEGTSRAIFGAIEATVANRVPGPQPFFRLVSFQETSGDPGLPLEFSGAQYWAGVSHPVDDRFILGAAIGYEENAHIVAGGFAFGEGRGVSILGFGAVRPTRRSLIAGMIGFGTFEYDLFTAGGLRRITYPGDRYLGAVSATYNVASVEDFRLFARLEAGFAHERLGSATDNLGIAVDPVSADASWVSGEFRFHDQIDMPLGLGTARPWTTLGAIWHPSEILDLDIPANEDWSLRLGGGVTIAHTSWLSSTVSGGTDYRADRSDLRVREWASAELRLHIVW